MVYLNFVLGDCSWYRQRFYYFTVCRPKSYYFYITTNIISSANDITTISIVGLILLILLLVGYSSVVRNLNCILEVSKAPTKAKSRKPAYSQALNQNKIDRQRSKSRESGRQTFRRHLFFPSRPKEKAFFVMYIINELVIFG